MVALMVVSGITSVWQAPQAQAATITNRSLTLMNGTGPADYATTIGPTARVRHKFQFKLGSTHTLGSVKVQYCTTAEDPSGGSACTAPAGIDLTTTTNPIQFENETGSGVTGFALGTGGSAPTTNSFVLTRTAASATLGTDVIFQMRNAQNPSVVGTFFARITTYSGTDGTTGPQDFGTTAAATTNQILISGFMPESLVFCAGQTVNANCTTVTNATIYFNQLFSPTSTATASSQMAASSNANYGYTINAYGDTLKAGTNTIAAMSTAGTLSVGSAQFGLNLKANTNTATATYVRTAEVTPSADGSTYRGQAKGNYATVDTFAFSPLADNIVAASDNGGAGPSNSQVYTVTYAVNVPGNQVAGNYTTTLSYICTPTY